ncbi:MAG: histidine kinase, partial [Bacteroidota bacterium]
QFVQGNEFLGKFSRLIRRVLDQSVAPAIPLSEELATLKLYLDVEKIRLEHKLHYDIQIDQNVEVDFISVPPLVLQPFVENAIWHGIAPKKGKGTISIHCKMSENDQFLNVVISDDGVGLSPKLPQTKAHQSKGIKITEERLGKMGSVAIFDRQTEGKKGVKVQLVIPTSDQI